MAENADFDLVLQEVAARCIPKEVELMDSDASIRSRPFLETLQQNDRIETVHLDGLLLSGNDVAALLDNSSSASSFVIDNCAAESQVGAVAIAGALGRSTTVKSLALRQLSTEFMEAIVEGSVRNVSAKELHCDNQHGMHADLPNTEKSIALGLFLTSSTSIEELHLESNHFSAAAFQPACQGLVQSQSIAALRLHDCHMGPRVQSTFSSFVSNQIESLLTAYKMLQIQWWTFP